MNKKILILDDDTDFVEVIYDLLSRNFDCIPCIDPWHALEILRSDKSVELVISDFKMPQMSGAEFLKLLRADGNLVPIVFLSGQLTLQPVLDALRMGATDLIEKPVMSQDLEKVINRSLYIEERRRKYYGSMGKREQPDSDKMLGLLLVNSAQNPKKSAS